MVISILYHPLDLFSLEAEGVGITGISLIISDKVIIIITTILSKSFSSHRLVRPISKATSRAITIKAIIEKGDCFSAFW